jgi:hypothetical protein
VCEDYDKSRRGWYKMKLEIGGTIPYNGFHVGHEKEFGIYSESKQILSACTFKK